VCNIGISEKINIYEKIFEIVCELNDPFNDKKLKYLEEFAHMYYHDDLYAQEAIHMFQKVYAI
jgi:hypothetical protein